MKFFMRHNPRHMKISDLFTDGVLIPEDARLEDWYFNRLIDSGLGQWTLNGNHPLPIKRIWKIDSWQNSLECSPCQRSSACTEVHLWTKKVAVNKIYMVDYQILDGIQNGWGGQQKGWILQCQWLFSFRV